MTALIIIDYDATYTADKALWDMLISAALTKKYVVVCCTMRFAALKNLNQDVIHDMGKHNVPIVYAAEEKDKWEAMQMAGYQPENAIWIDDRPMFIFRDREIDELLG
ncbi:MAG: hypothetical protein KAG20_09155 [Cocleimonas sp.]|nr:hypothetical protein [Cocleimonas sp.]